MKSLLVVGGVFLALGVALALPAWAQHGEARAAWRRARLELSTNAYDAAESDRLYHRVEETRLDAEEGGFLTVLGLMLLAAGWSPRPAAPLRRPLVVTVADGVVGVGVFALAHFGDSLALWDSSENAFAAAFEQAAPLFLLLPHAPLLAGRSIGLACAGAGLPEDRALRLRAALLGPLAFPVLLLVFWNLGRYSTIAAIHLPAISGPEKQPGPRI